MQPKPETRFLHVPVSPEFLRAVGLAAREKDLQIRDFVVQALTPALTLKNATPIPGRAKAARKSTNPKARKP